MYNDSIEENSINQNDDVQMQELDNRAIQGGIIVIPGGTGGFIPNVSVSRVRFLNAADGYGALRIVVGSNLITNNLPYTNVTSYNNISVGFRTVTITSPASPRMVSYQSTIPFNPGEVATLAIIKTGRGLDLIRISDINISPGFMGRGSIRMANLAFNSPPLDLFLTNHRAVFSDVRYKEVTQARQAQAREYEMYIAQTPYAIEPRFNDIETIEDMPIITTFSDFEPLVSIIVNIKPSVMSTIYVFGTWGGLIQTRVIDNR